MDRKSVCIVTGGTQGVGWAIVQALARSGARVFACGLSERNLLQAEVARRMLPQAAQISLAQCDITDRSQYEQWLDQVMHEVGPVDVLVNNAAYVQWTDVNKMSVEEAERSMAVAFHGMLYGVKKLLPNMLAARQGHIINIGSITGTIYVGGASAAYSAAKAAVEGYTRTLYVELRGKPVHVSLIRLGTVAGTTFFREHVSHTRMPWLLDFIPPLAPDDVGAAVVRVLKQPREIVTIPWVLRPLSYVFALAPGFSRWLAWRFGSGRRHYREAPRRR